MNILTYALFAQVAVAFPHLAPHNKAWKPYVPAGPHDSRSPCPGLNSLANHGYLPHNGRNITRAAILAATRQVFNFDDALTDQLNAANFGPLGDPPALDLGDLGAPAATEKRGSMTRVDPEEPDYDVHAQGYLVDAVLADSFSGGSSSSSSSSGKGCNNGGGVLDIPSIAKTRLRVAELSGETGGPLSDEDDGAGSGTAALTFLTLPADLDWPVDWNGTYTPTVPKKWADDWLRDERIPFEHGWRTPGHVSTLEDLGALIGMIEAAKAQVATA